MTGSVSPIVLSVRRVFDGPSPPKHTRCALRGSATGWTSRRHERLRVVRSSTCSTSTATLIATDFGVDRTACHHPLGTATVVPGTSMTFTHDEV